MKKAYIQVMLAAAMWGIIGVFVREMTELGLSRMQIALLRSLVAAVAMIPVVGLTDRKLFKARWKDLWCFAGTGIVSLTMMNLCYFTAMQHTTLSVAAVLLYTAPAFVLLFSAVLFKEKLTIARLGALALVFGGCVMVTGALGGGAQKITPTGILYGLGAGLSYAMYSIFGRFALNRGYHTLTLTFYTFWFSVLGTIPFAKTGDLIHRMTPAVWLYAAGIGILCCVLPYLLYTKGLSKIDNGTASMLATLEPAVATLVSVWFFGEPLTWYNIIGIAFLFAGIMVLSRTSSREEDRETEK